MDAIVIIQNKEKAEIERGDDGIDPVDNDPSLTLPHPPN
jgi:hypothetical protein